MNTSQQSNQYIEISEAAKLLGVSEHALERWIRQGSIPFSRMRGEVVFDRLRLKDWAIAHNMTWMEPSQQTSSSPSQAIGLVNAVRDGGIYTGIQGTGVQSVLESAVSAINIPEDIEKNALLEKLLEREALASTGLGQGIAVPHPRTPLKTGFQTPSISVCFLDTPVPYNAIDDGPVFVLFLMFSPSTKVHLQLLARLGFCLRNQNFIDFLRTQPDLDSLCEKMEKMEKK